MAGFDSTHFLLLLALFITLFFPNSEGRKLTESDSLFQYHNGPLLTGEISINLIWYGKFKPSQRSIILDFVSSISSTKTEQPSVSKWWKITGNYHRLVNSFKHSSLNLSLGTQIFDENYSLGKSLKNSQIVQLSSKGGRKNSINVVLTSPEVTVDGFCSSRCGTHGFSRSGDKNSKFAYIWVGNSVSQCPGQCAWPFHQPIYGPQTAPLVSPNGDVGVDGMVINLASLLAGTVTNPFGNGYFQGPKDAPLEAGSGCAGIFGKGAYPGYGGEVLVDSGSGGSYNAHGVNGRKYLVPALFDPDTASCVSLV